MLALTDRIAKLSAETAYAVWTGIGAAGAFILGIFLYGDSAGLLRIFAVTLIVAGVALLKLAH